MVIDPILSYTGLVPKTNGTRGESRNIERRTVRRQAVFLRPYAYVRLLWAGTGGGIFGCAGSLSSRSLNLTCCLPTRLRAGKQGLSNSKGGRHG